MLWLPSFYLRVTELLLKVGLSFLAGDFCVCVCFLFPAYWCEVFTSPDLQPQGNLCLGLTACKIHLQWVMLTAMQDMGIRWGWTWQPALHVHVSVCPMQMRDILPHSEIGFPRSCSQSFLPLHIWNITTEFYHICQCFSASLWYFDIISIK